MSVHLIEVLIYAGLAVYLVNKLLNTIGSTDEDDPVKNKGSIFGEFNPASSEQSEQQTSQEDTSAAAMKEVQETDPGSIQEDKYLQERMAKIQNLLPGFTLSKFINNATKAVSMILETARTKDQKMLDELVDTRFKDKFMEHADKNYQDVNKLHNPQIKLVDAHTFGNNISITVQVTTYSPEANEQTLEEEWTFIKNANSNKPNWYLSNIIRD